MMGYGPLMTMYLTVLALAGCLCFFLSLRALFHLRHRGFWAFALVQFGMAWWIACYLGEELAAPEDRLIWFELKFVGIGLIAPAWMIYTTYHVGRPLKPWLRIALFWEWLALIPVIFTNESHHMLYRSVSWVGEITAKNGPLALIHIVWNYCLLLGATVTLIRFAFRSEGARRRELMALVGAGILPWIGSIGNEFLKMDNDLRAFIPLNPTLPGFALSSLFTGWAVLRLRILNPIAIAREHLFDTMADALVILDDRAVIADANQAAEVMLRTKSAARHWRLSGERAEVAFAPWPQIADRLDPEKRTHCEIWVEAENGKRCYDFQIHPLFGSHTECIGWLLAGRDITERKALEGKLRFLGNHDALTGLYNRAFIEEESERLRKSRAFPVSVIVFDLDSLKETNDSMGHAAGDELIRSMGNFLGSFFRGGDLVARMGGDEFWAVLPSTSEEQLAAIELRLDQELRVYNQGREIQLAFSRGSAVISSAKTWNEALVEADRRMYASKKTRRAAGK